MAMTDWARASGSSRLNVFAVRCVVPVMHSMLRTSFLGVIVTLVLAASAQASDHLMQVTEVHPSASDPGMAFVELQDLAFEPFPSTSYTLASLDASGAVLGQQVFSSPYGFAGNAQPFLAGALNRQPRDAALTIPLAVAGKVCFYRGTGTSDAIHCLTFAAVPEGQSAQLTTSGAVVFGCPTPVAANRQSAEPCASASPTPGPAPAPLDPALVPASPASTSAPIADRRAPKLAISARRVQRLGRLRASVIVDERSRVSASGSFRIAGRALALITTRRQVVAGVRTTLRLTLTRQRTAAVRRALKRGAAPTVIVKVVARDSAGNRSTRKLKISLKS